MTACGMMCSKNTIAALVCNISGRLPVAVRLCWLCCCTSNRHAMQANEVTTGKSSDHNYMSWDTAGRAREMIKAHILGKHVSMMATHSLPISRSRGVKTEPSTAA
eukprot:1159078-Pelagomonas_calceolata.AAC.6